MLPLEKNSDYKTWILQRVRGIRGGSVTNRATLSTFSLITHLVIVYPNSASSAFPGILCYSFNFFIVSSFPWFPRASLQDKAVPDLWTNLLVFLQLQRPCSEGLVVKDTDQATLFKCHVVLAQGAHVLTLGAGVGVV